MDTMDLDVRTSAQDDQLATNLARVPPEILDRVTKHLTTPELGHLRLSCKIIERRLFPAFAIEFFSKKQYMVTSFSLGALVDISRHRGLNPYIEEVQIGMDRYPVDPLGNIMDPTVEKDFKRGRNDQLVFLSSGCHKEMLIEAFKNLPKLQRIVIRDNNSWARRRDGPHAEWKSYGASTADKFATIRSRGTDWTPYTDILGLSGTQYVSAFFSLLLAALGSARNYPQSLQLLLRQRTTSLQDEAFCIPDFLEPSVKPVLENLQVLHLRCSPSVWRAHLSRGSPGYDNMDLNLRYFLGRTPNLKHLRLNFDHSPLRVRPHSVNSPGHSEILLWLAHHPDHGHPTLLRGAAYANLPKLEQLDIGEFLVSDPAQLVALAKHFSSTLVCLSLHRVCLVGKVNDRRFLWREPLRAFGEMEKLRTLSLTDLTQTQEGATARFRMIIVPTSITDQGPKIKSMYVQPVRTRPTDFYYRGNFIGERLEEYMKRVTIDWPPEIVESPMDTDDDEDEQEEDEDEELDSEGDSQMAG